MPCGKGEIAYFHFIDREKVNSLSFFDGLGYWCVDYIPIQATRFSASVQGLVSIPSLRPSRGLFLSQVSN